MARKTEIQATMLLHAAQIHQIYVVENEPASSCTLVWSMLSVVYIWPEHWMLFHISRLQLLPNEM